MSLQLNNVTAGYTKSSCHDITFDVNPGEICGLIGLNGAGKSTTIKKRLLGNLPLLAEEWKWRKLSISKTNRLPSVDCGHSRKSSSL